MGKFLLKWHEFMQRVNLKSIERYKMSYTKVILIDLWNLKIK